PVPRSGARPGNVVAVAGRLGWSAAGQAVLSRGFGTPKALVTAHRRPVPPYPAGPVAAELGATAMCDVSDGLVQDLGHIAAASGVRVELDTSALPVAEALAQVGAAFGGDPLRWVLAGGEDHALVATFPDGTALGEGWTLIGKVGEGAGVVVDGRPYGDDGGWDHFR
ncbi:MAG: AIR synthase-related protein, partial [Streptosporangiaceae bacterium]